jgi:hypothetical protein
VSDSQKEKENKSDWRAETIAHENTSAIISWPRPTGIFKSFPSSFSTLQMSWRECQQKDDHQELHYANELDFHPCGKISVGLATVQTKKKKKINKRRTDKVN